MTYENSNNEWFQINCPELDVSGSTVAIVMSSMGTGTVCFDGVFFAALPEQDKERLTKFILEQVMK